MDPGPDGKALQFKGNHRARWSWRGTRILLLLAPLLIIVPHFLTNGLTNAGNLGLVRAVRAIDAGQVDNHAAKLLEWAADRFEQALALNPNHVAARWSLGRAGLNLAELGKTTSRDAVVIATTLEPLAAGDARNPLIYQDALMSLGYAGLDEEVIALYEQHPPPERTQTISDTVASAYLHRNAAGDLRRAQALRPGDLYANLLLWRGAQESGDAQAAVNLTNRLSYFPLEAVHPTIDRLLYFAGLAISDLVDEKLWDQAKVMYVVSFLVEQHFRSTAVKQLLMAMVKRYPGEAEWLYNLAELLHRQGDLEQAAKIYREMLAMSAGNAQAYLRLGMVAEEICRSKMTDCAELALAAAWYEQYVRAKPDDLLGLSRMAEVCAAMEDGGVRDESCREASNRVAGLSVGESKTLTPAVALKKALAARNDDQSTVAELLNVESRSVRLGKNILHNGGFENWSRQRPDGWKWADMATGDPWSRGTVAGSADRLAAMEGSTSLRADALWFKSEEEKPPGRGGWWPEKKLELNLDAHSDYVLSFSYRTEGLSDGAVKVWLSPGHSTNLPSTNGEWHHKALLLRDRTSDGTVQPLFMVFFSGRFWVDEVEIKSVDTGNVPSD
jgi:tetratricopeptide (TPR) repeat protein